MRQLIRDAQRARAMQQGKPASDSGVALLLVIAWGVIFMMLAIGVVAGVNALTRSSGTTDNYYSAYAAAQAGIDDFIARMNLDSNYWKSSATGYGNPLDAEGNEFQGASGAFAGNMVPVAGSATDESFTFPRYGKDILASNTAKTNQVILTVEGKAGRSRRVLQAILRPRSPFDYAFSSYSSASDPDNPDVAANSQYDSSKPLVISSAHRLCEWGFPNPPSNTQNVLSGPARLWWEDSPDRSGPFYTSTRVHTTAPDTRDNAFCWVSPLYDGETFVGDIHSNDTWYFAGAANNGGLSSAEVTGGSITSSCPTTTSNEPGKCPVDHDWINFAITPSSKVTNNNNLYSATGVATDGVNGNIIDTGGTGPASPLNPTWGPMVPQPASNLRLRADAAAAGCIFTGPTRILFSVNGTGQGLMTITSPDTKNWLSPSPKCPLAAAGDTTGTGLMATKSTSQPSETINIATATAAGFNGIIYVQNNPSSSSDPNYWPTNTEPSCTTTKNKIGAFPFVIAPDGSFPATNDSNTASWFNCESGDVFTQGKVAGSVTLATANNLGFTASIYYADATGTNPTGGSETVTGFGTVPSASTNYLGIAPLNYLYFYTPVSNNTNTNGTFNPTATNDVLLDFTGIALQHCFTTLHWSDGKARGRLNVFGSLSGMYNCPVGATSNHAGGTVNQGFERHYTFDGRLKKSLPPGMQDLISGSWHRTLTTELALNAVG